MALPRRAHDPSFARYLRQQGIAPSTIKVYSRVHRRLDLADPVGWLQAQVASQRPVQGTLDVWRTVVWHTLRHGGINREAATAAIPRLKGRPAKRRRALSAEELDLYKAHAQRRHEPIRTILLLLPETGLRISEACTLRTDNVKRAGDRYILDLRSNTKGEDPRVVPLNKAALGILQSYLRVRPQDTTWLFPGNRGTSMTPAAVRKQTRAIAGMVPTLRDLSPHVLRHTFCTNLLAKGAKLPEVQALAGHKSVQTTSRYLHPSTEQLGKAVDRL